MLPLSLHRPLDLLPPRRQCELRAEEQGLNPTNCVLTGTRCRSHLRPSLEALPGLLVHLLLEVWLL
jgi:hypothetical protein